MTSTPRVEPMRQGVHLPQDSSAQNQQLTSGQKFVVNAGSDLGLFAHGRYRRRRSRKVIVQRIEQ